MSLSYGKYKEIMLSDIFSENEEEQMNTPPYTKNGHVSIHQYYHKMLKGDHQHIILPPPPNTLSPYELEYALNNNNQFIPAIIGPINASGDGINEYLVSSPKNMFEFKKFYTLAFMNKNLAYDPNGLTQKDKKELENMDPFDIPEKSYEGYNDLDQRDIMLPNVIPIGIMSEINNKNIDPLTTSLLNSLVALHASALTISGYDILIKNQNQPDNDKDEMSNMTGITGKLRIKKPDRPYFLEIHAIQEIEKHTQPFRPDKIHNNYELPIIYPMAYCPSLKIVDPISRYEIALAEFKYNQQRNLQCPQIAYDIIKTEKNPFRSNEYIIKNKKLSREQQALDAVSTGISSMAHTADYIIKREALNMPFHDFMTERLIDPDKLITDCIRIESDNDAKDYSKHRINMLANMLANKYLIEGEFNTFYRNDGIKVKAGTNSSQYISKYFPKEPIDSEPI